jgi:Amt family ammonium transporter
MAAAAGTISWVFTEWIHRGKPTVLGAASGCIAGLGTITPASGFVQPGAAVLIGLAAGALCYSAVMMKGRFGYDDSLDVVGVHCVGGTLGTLATGLFATKAVNAAGANGLLFGNPRQLAVQALAAGVILLYSFAATWILLKVLDRVMGLRVTDEHEFQGLDITQHGEAGYNA